MKMTGYISGMLRRHLWGALWLCGVMLTLAACSDTVVDDDSATIITRKTDTVVRHDTTTEMDTVIVADTLRLTDTVVRFDTVVRVQTIIKTDTLYRKDTVRVRDTVVRYDTIPDTRGRFTGNGLIYLKSRFSSVMVDSVPIVFDPASLLEVDRNSSGKPSALRLRLTARAARPYNWYIWGDKCIWFMYLLVEFPDIYPPTPNMRKEFTRDPREGSPGLAVVPHPPMDARWLATGVTGCSGTFTLHNIDQNARRVNASFKAQFSDPEFISIDSAALKMMY